MCVVIAVGMVRTGGPPLPSPPAPNPFFGKMFSRKDFIFLRTQASGPFQLRMSQALQPLCPLTFKFFSMCLALVVQEMDSTIQWISMRKMNCALPWIEIYLMDSVIHLLNNWDQVRDGPLENLWGGRAKYQKNIRAREN